MYFFYNLIIGELILMLKQDGALCGPSCIKIKGFRLMDQDEEE